jgi:hypothetical protein
LPPFELHNSMAHAPPERTQVKTSARRLSADHRSSVQITRPSDHPTFRSPDHPILCDPLLISRSSRLNWVKFALILGRFPPSHRPKPLLLNNWAIFSHHPTPTPSSTQLHPRSPNVTQASAEGQYCLSSMFSIRGPRRARCLARWGGRSPKLRQRVATGKRS